MKITKFGHCCLLIEEKGDQGMVRIVTDPGNYTTAQDTLTGVDVILITHEHADHFHIESVKALVANNPSATIVTNKAVGKLLAKEGIAYTLADHGVSVTVKGVSFEGFGRDHAYVYKTIPEVENTGYLIAKRLFYPGDSYCQPGRPVEILALPVGGPWVKVSEAIDYALAVKPKKAFPVHDAGLKSSAFVVWIAGGPFKEAGIEMVAVEIGKEYEF